MPIFEIAENELLPVEQKNFSVEKELQALIEGALKVDMFNSGEVQVMRDTQLGPVFFGEALIGDDVPSLAYMLSASDREAHKGHWEKFIEHPQWQRMSKMAKYKDTVSKITNFFLEPTAYSQI